MKSLCFTLTLIVAFAIQAKAADEITVRIGSGSVEIAKDQAEAKRFCDSIPQDGMVLVVCKQLQVTRDASTFLVRCTDMKLINTTTDKISAADAKFDLIKDHVVMNGFCYETGTTKANVVQIERSLALLRNIHVNKENNTVPSQEKQPAK